MVEKLENITTITTGYYQKPDSMGNIYYLHGKHFDQEGNLKTDATLSKDILLDKRNQKHLLEDRDVLFIAKGDNNRACIYYETYGPAMASSLFFVLRPDKDRLLPEYLQWYLNTPFTQHQLARFSRGTHIPSIAKKLLKELDIYVPPIAIQEQILEVDRLWRQEKKITQEILHEKEQYYQHLLIDLAKEKFT